MAGHWGQYGTARVIQIAEGYGYNDTEGIELAARHLAGGDLTDSEFDALTECGYDAENYLNDHVAGDGYLWGWHDGEFFYWTTATWEEAF